MKIANKITFTNIILAIAMIIIGIIFIMIPDSVLTTALRIIGAFLLAFGLISVITYMRKTNIIPNSISYGILTSVLGLIFIVNPVAIASILPIMIGIWLIISATFKLQNVVDLKNANNNNWVKVLLIGLINITLGIILIFNPFKTSEILMTILGIFIIASAILDIIGMFFIRSKVKQIAQVIIEDE